MTPKKILVTGKSYLSPRWPIDHSQALQKKLRTDSQVAGRSSSPAAAVLVVLRWCSLAPQLETRKSSWLIHADHLIIQMFKHFHGIFLKYLTVNLYNDPSKDPSKNGQITAVKPRDRCHSSTEQHQNKISLLGGEKKKTAGSKEPLMLDTDLVFSFPIWGVEIFFKKESCWIKCQLNPQDWLQVKMPCLHQMNSQHPRGIHLQDPRASC